MAKGKRTKKLKNISAVQDKVFWIVLGVVFILSTVVILANFDTHINLTGNAVVRTVSYMKAGSELFFEVKVAGIHDIKMTFNEDVKNSLIKTEEVDDVSWNFDGVAFSKIKISSVAEDKINEGIQITLKVKESELLAAGIARGDVNLFVNGEKLETTFEKLKDEHLYYKSVSPSLGEFVIGKEIVKEVEIVEEVPEPIVEEEPVVEEVVEEEEGFFTKIGNFFKGLFD